ncbi:hypothetical protein D3C86_2071800 [compost metagenome]
MESLVCMAVGMLAEMQRILRFQPQLVGIPPVFVGAIARDKDRLAGSLDKRPAEGNSDAGLVR